MRIKKEIVDILVNGTRAERYYICEKDPLYFAVYYFPEFFKYPFADFHYQMFDDYLSQMRGDTAYLQQIMFRESAKTSITKICLTHAICYKLKKYINYDSYDKKNAEAALFDVVSWLQTKRALKADFGELYNTKRSPDEVTKKRVSDFVTNNGVRVEAHSTQESVRGRIFQEQRPDWFIFDDFENEKTVTSPPVTEKIMAHMDAAISGLAPDATVTFICNRISESGAVAYIEARLKDNPRAIVRDVPVYTPEGVITWPGKYVMTDAERKDGMVSIETKKREIANFEAEMLNQPQASNDIFFDRAIIEAMPSIPPEKQIGGVTILKQYKPDHRYAIGADTSEGVGLDSQTLAVIDFTTGEVVATYANNQVSPIAFAHILKRTSELYGNCLICPERNNTGFAVITELLSLDPYIFKDPKHLAGRPTATAYGYRTDASNKYDLFFQLKRAVEDGKLQLRDKDLIEEAKYYTHSRLGESTSGLITRHFDLLTATAIGWEMRKHASVATDPYDEMEREHEVSEGKQRNFTL